MLRFFPSGPARSNSAFMTCLLLMSTLAGFCGNALAQTAPGAQPPSGTGKEGRSYVSIGTTMNEFRSVELVLDSNVGYDQDGDYLGSNVDVRFPLTGQTWAVQFKYGSYINDYFLYEWRGGTSYRDDTLKGFLDVQLKYWLAFHLGFSHPITDYMSGFFKYGVSHYEADTTRRQGITNVPSGELGQPQDFLVEPSPEFMEDGLFGTRISTSWMIGIDYKITNDWYLTFEYGRLLKDDDTGIKVRQHAMELKYEF